MSETKAKAEFDKACANLGGVGMACFLTEKEQDQAFNEAFKRLALAGVAYVRELQRATLIGHQE